MDASNQNRKGTEMGEPTSGIDSKAAGLEWPESLATPALAAGAENHTKMDVIPSTSSSQKRPHKDENDQNPEHKSQRLLVEMRPYKCSECDKCFKTKPRLLFHMKSHTEKKLCACDECDKTFTASYNLNAHKRMVHHGVRPYACSECNKCFQTAQYLNIHKRIHTGEEPFTCDRCDEKFINSSNLSAHKKKIHLKIRPLALQECKVCNKCFVSRFDLVRHLRIHSGEKPFACDQCDKSFTQSSTLKSHKMSMHTTKNSKKHQKPFACDECDATFTASYSVTKHKNMVHRNIRPYKCSECIKCFQTAQNLHVHKIAVHKIHTR